MRDKNDPNLTSRREFMRHAACAAVGTFAMTATIRDLRFMNAAVAQGSPSDYKALVCIFLNGGNDSNNWIIPTTQSDYDLYSAIRTSALAIPLTSAPANKLVLGVTSDNPDGHTYGFHPACPELVTLFNEHKLAMMFNTGPLLYPMNRTSYKANILPKPPQLFSHADQITHWQTSIPDQPPATGWGGRCADLLASLQPNAPISLSVSLAGANTFEIGNIVSQYSVSSSGAIALALPGGGTSQYTNRQTALTNILGLPYTNLQSQAYAKVAKHTIDTTTILNNAISVTAAANYWNPQFPGPIIVPSSGTQYTSNSGLGQQLRMIARLIEAAQRPVPGGLQMKRQIFFCTVGGYDTHTTQTPGASDPSIGSHANLLAELSQGMFAFQRAMEKLDLTYPGISSQVTAFTASDFGRTFPINGDGTDHGWGSHHVVMGGAVQGKRTYGKFPTLAIGGPDDVDTGRWIPSTACDQYFATLATWFGVQSGDLSTVFPNLGRFTTPNLGFV